MKKDAIRVSLNAEKLRAIKKYMDKKEIDLEDELVDQLQKLYEKYVPANVREYIDEKQEEEIKAKKPKKTVKTKAEVNNQSIIQE
ncbi:hypothetical protein KQI38_00230 [Tissierella carlieri]|uniref:DUF6103 family protein n=1 Tax=Tissierella carlieri TaxID=689904 RepID=UPI001C10007B|nr:DUF6103 family protein [Tissierella carlieri]MBU5310443.1 hypothetical protein [Tissierella carlieri]